jgi:beta-lactamase class A
MSLARRTVLAVPVGAAALLGGHAGHAGAARPAPKGIAALEAAYATTIGLSARNLRTGRSLGHRLDERQPVLSTFKPLVAAALLARGADLDDRVSYRRSDVVDYSPVTGERRAMTLGELADAAIRFSDNTAGNLLLRRLGGDRGPAALTAYLRRLGDDVTRLERWETELNAATPGDPRDTSTPRALAATYHRLLVGDALPATARWALRGWLQSNTTSVEKFRTGLPDGWWCADKTGGGSYGTQNDVGVITAPEGTEILFAIQTRASTTDPDAVGSPDLMKALAELLVDRLG